MDTRTTSYDDLMERVVCDLCDGDYSVRNDHGGLILGGKAICPQCEKKGTDRIRNARSRGNPVALPHRNEGFGTFVRRIRRERQVATHALDALDEVAREGIRRMLEAALEAEVAQYIASHAKARDASGQPLVVRGREQQSCSVTCGPWTFQVRVPRVNDRRVDDDGKRQRFSSRILPPPYLLRAPQVVAKERPLLYLRGLSTGDFRAALPVLLGEGAAGLNPTNIGWLTATWDEDYQAFRHRDLSKCDYIYVWVGGTPIHRGTSLFDECMLVVIGVQSDGAKELVAIEDGYRERTESWASMLRDLRRRGLRAPVAAVGDDALGFWSAARDVWIAEEERADYTERPESEKEASDD